MKAIQSKLGDGKTILIEVVEPPEIVSAQGTGGAAAGVASPTQVLSKLDEVAETITETCKALFQKVASGFDQGRPDELGVEFGVTLGGEAGIPLVTKGTVEAAFKVMATWKFDNKQPRSSEDV